ncbi:MAG: hypothetical protein MJY56_07295 [Bacteroidales bacterium]|nr:hypothetical protein [Bacteroidales bacterium]
MAIKTRIIALAAGIFLFGAPLSAQLSSTVFVSGTEGYTDCISLSRDSKDMDVIVKFSFDEAANTLKLSLTSYRGMFVFYDNMRYSKAFKLGKLNPERLPYEVESPGKSTYHSTSVLRASLRKPVGKYVFHRWIEYDGLQAVPAGYRMVNDRIEQLFTINGRRAVVSITLRDIMLMDPAKKEGRYNFVFDKDMSKRYDVVILRDGCFGKEEDIAAASEALGTVSAAYDTLKTRFPGGIARTKESADVFEQMKTMLLTQFKKKDADNDCGCIMEDLTRYNAYIDSVSVMTVKVPAPTVVTKPKETTTAPAGINADNMFARARKIDMAVSRWKVTTDALEKKDIEKSCRSIIAAGKEEIRVKGVYTQNQKNARDAFLSAESYFNRTCVK